VAAARHKIEWRWVKGHAGDPDNERADMLANEAITNLRSEQGTRRSA
jgi:ribonuclease HI